MTTIQFLSYRAVWLGAILLTASGCQTLQLRDGIAVAPRTNGPISRVVVLWSEAVLRQDNVPVAQGFAGKVYMFGTESDSPVTAPGKFTIYAYDETSIASDRTKPAHVKPDYTWEVSESDLKQLLKKDQIGWSYSLWLPCGAPMPVERRFTLMLCFTPENGSKALSEYTLVTLPAMGGDLQGTLAQSSSPTRTPTNNQPVALTRTLLSAP